MIAQPRGQAVCGLMHDPLDGFFESGVFFEVCVEMPIDLREVAATCAPLHEVVKVLCQYRFSQSNAAVRHGWCWFENADFAGQPLMWNHHVVRAGRADVHLTLHPVEWCHIDSTAFILAVKRSCEVDERFCATNRVDPWCGRQEEVSKEVLVGTAELAKVDNDR